MAKNKNIFMQEFRNRPLTYTVQAVGVIVILLNVWLAGKLVPLAKDLDALVSRVQANENKISVNAADIKQCSDMKTDIATIKTSIGNIETNLNTLDQRLSRHLGI